MNMHSVDQSHITVFIKCIPISSCLNHFEINRIVSYTLPLAGRAYLMSGVDVMLLVVAMSSHMVELVRPSALVWVNDWRVCKSWLEMGKPNKVVSSTTSVEDCCRLWWCGRSKMSSGNWDLSRFASNHHSSKTTCQIFFKLYTIMEDIMVPNPIKSFQFFLNIQILMIFFKLWKQT